MAGMQKLFAAAGFVVLMAASAPAQGGQTGAQQTTRINLTEGAAGMASYETRFKSWLQAVPSGSGPYGTVREEFTSLPDHTVFRPAKLDEVKDKVPIVAFGNGGCRNTPIEFTAFLPEIASGGYFVVAAGRNDVEFATTDFSKRSANGKPLQSVSRSVLTSAVDWAIQENSRRGGPFYGKLATDKIAYMGQSCGGMQALSASTDPRTTTTIVLNSGRFARDMKGPTGGQFSEWFEWSELHAPITFFNGGPKDVQVAHQNFAEITSLPVFLADLPVGHTGAYPGPDMRWVKAVTGWLDWQLKGDGTARAMFVGPKCGLCTDLDWTVTGSKDLTSQLQQGQAAPAPAPTVSSTGGDIWSAPPGTSISINRSTGVASFVLATQPVDGSREQFARYDNWRKHPYSGTGPYPATRAENDALPTHTLYYPADPGKVPGKMPVILWANGGCRNTSVEFTRFLGEIASNGYFIAAIGRSDIPFRVTDDLVVGERKAGDTRPLRNESPTDMLKGLDYAIAENGRQSSKFFGKIDTAKVAVIGQSCGGLQAFNAARDSRVTAAVAVNSHFLSRKHSGGMSMSFRASWEAYADWFVEDLKIPAAYFTGGPADSAYNNAEISYQGTSGAQPTVKVDMPLMGHTGAYPMPDTRWTNAVLSWLNFILKNDLNGKAMFAGEKCGLCSDPDFWVKTKGLK